VGESKSKAGFGLKRFFRPKPALDSTPHQSESPPCKDGIFVRLGFRKGLPKGKISPRMLRFEKSVAAKFVHPKLPEPVVNLSTIVKGTGGQE
jgi:hypothetical protein